MKQKKTLPKSITSEEFVKLMKKVPTSDRIAKTSFCLAYGSGLRLSEVWSLKKEDIRTDMKPPMINVIQGKGGQDRQVPLPKGWKDYMMKVLPFKCSVRTLERKLKRYAKEAGLNPLYSFHSLRHGFAVRSFERGIPPNQVQLLMGHSNLATTSIYTKARPLDAIKSYEDLF